MTPELIDAAGRLADTIARENAALDALDLPLAAGLLAEKQAAMVAFGAAERLAQQTGPYMMAGRQRQEVLKQAERVIGTLVSGVKPIAQRYGAQGSLHRSSLGAIALSSSA